MQVEPSYGHGTADRPIFERRDSQSGDLGARRLYYLVFAEFLASPVLSLINDTYKIEVAGLSLLQLVRGILLGLMVVCLFRVSVPAPRSLKVFLPIILLVFYSAVLTIVAVVPKNNAIATFKIAYPCVMGIATYVVISHGFLNEGRMGRVAWYWLLSYVISQLAALHYGVQSAYRNEYSAAGFGTNASTADGLILLVPYFLLSERWRTRDVLGIGIALLSTSLAMRRTAMLGVLATGLTGIIVRAFRQNSEVQAKLVAIITVAGIFLGFSYALTSTNWGDAFWNRLEDTGGSGRTTIWQYGVKHVLDRGLLLNIIGEGDGAFTAWLANMWAPFVTHNGWLTLVLNYGLIGVLLYVSFFSYLGVLLVRAYYMHDSSFEVLVSTLVGIVCAEAAQGFLLGPEAVPTYVMISLLIARMNRYYGDCRAFR